MATASSSKPRVRARRAPSLYPGVRVSDPRDDEIRRLKDQLWMARDLLFRLLPEPARKVLDSYHHCVSIEETYSWHFDISDALIDLAEPLPRVLEIFGERANCPLCGEGSQSFYEKGYALPEGLRMHLEGKGNASMCRVMRIAIERADEHWSTDFHPRGSPERFALEARIAARRQRETQYLVDPYKAPRLSDEGFDINGPRVRRARPAEQMPWALERLAELGFERVVERKVQRFTKDAGNITLFADPRTEGGLAICVVANPVRYEASHWERRQIPTVGIVFADKLKRDLVAKLDEMTAEAVKVLFPRPTSVPVK